MHLDCARKFNKICFQAGLFWEEILLWDLRPLFSTPWHKAWRHRSLGSTGTQPYWYCHCSPEWGQQRILCFSKAFPAGLRAQNSGISVGPRYLHRFALEISSPPLTDTNTLPHNCHFIQNSLYIFFWLASLSCAQFFTFPFFTCYLCIFLTIPTVHSLKILFLSFLFSWNTYWSQKRTLNMTMVCHIVFQVLQEDCLAAWYSSPPLSMGDTF